MRYIVTSFILLIFFSSCKQENPKVTIKTDLGVIVIELYENKAPVTSKNFIKYIDEKRWEGATFYRVVTSTNQPESNVKIEVIQGGLYEDDHPQALPPIIHENTSLTGIKHLDGVISMARYEPGTATFEFFICVGNQPSLDYGGNRNPDNEGFAAFGKVVEGMDVILKIHNQPEKNQYLDPRILINNMQVLH